uniref:ZP domain-containing protein n=1 Tax=Meloidogyne hapla TaxID=6305 RepID=A0A1I8B5E1_MELHA
MIIKCQKRERIFNLPLEENLNFYSSDYYNYNVCHEDKYFIYVEENVYGIPYKIPFECDEAINENDKENVYIIKVSNSKRKNSIKLIGNCELKKDNNQIQFDSNKNLEQLINKKNKGKKIYFKF